MKKAIKPKLKNREPLTKLGLTRRFLRHIRRPNNEYASEHMPGRGVSWSVDGSCGARQGLYRLATTTSAPFAVCETVSQWCEIRPPNISPGTSTLQGVASSGFQHIKGHRTRFVEGLRDSIVEYLAPIVDPAAMESLRRLTLFELMHEHPYLVAWLLEALPSVEWVANPVRLQDDPGGSPTSAAHLQIDKAANFGVQTSSLDT